MILKLFYHQAPPIVEIPNCSLRGQAGPEAVAQEERRDEQGQLLQGHLPPQGVQADDRTGVSKFTLSIKLMIMSLC